MVTQCFEASATFFVMAVAETTVTLSSLLLLLSPLVLLLPLPPLLLLLSPLMLLLPLPPLLLSFMPVLQLPVPPLESTALAASPSASRRATPAAVEAGVCGESAGAAVTQLLSGAMEAMRMRLLSLIGVGSEMESRAMCDVRVAICAG